jgi:YVTN family beta-propeller protein
MRVSALFLGVSLLCAAAWGTGERPGPREAGNLLPNGWSITPVGKSIPTEDLLMNLIPSPDGKVMVAVTCGYNPHGLVVVDDSTDEVVQRITVPAAWFGLAWHPDGTKLYVSGGNNKRKGAGAAPIYVFGYANCRLSEDPVQTLQDDLPQEETFWSGVVHHPAKPLLFAANRTANNITVFDSKSGAKIARIPTELTPYDLVLSPDGKTLSCSNMGSDTVSFFDTDTLKVTATVAVGDNPNDMVLARDGRLFVCCSNDNRVVVIDTKKGRAVESIVTSLYDQAPEGSTPNSVALDPEDEETLYIANADNNNVCVVDVDEPGDSTVLGFIPAGWYPSAVAVGPEGEKLYIGNGKGVASYATPHGPHAPIQPEDGKSATVKSLQKGAIGILEIEDFRPKLRELTKQAYANCPYNDDLLASANESTAGPSVIPSKVGAGSSIKHVIYIIKENRTYDQVLGDMPQGNGDPSLTLFGREITPNIHAITEQFVLFDSLYCDAEVSADGHQWSNAAYATDYIEKNWPASYAGRSESPRSAAGVPHSGYIWDRCAEKGLTYRTYGEFAQRQSEDGIMEPILPGLGTLNSHVAPKYFSWGVRDTENAAEFIREFDGYEKHYDSPKPEERLPNFIVMALPEDHTHGTGPDSHTPRACVASNDAALGMIVDRVSHSRYWPEIAIFAIEDDAQDGSDHLEARRTEGLLISPYVRRKTVDSTLYTTSSMLRTIELLLGLQPMSQYDAAATPMYAALSDTPDLTPYSRIEPLIDIREMNAKTSWGAKESQEMDFSIYDKAPMFELNEIIWKSIKGADSQMPLPVHRFQYASLR